MDKVIIKQDSSKQLRLVIASLVIFAIAIFVFSFTSGFEKFFALILTILFGLLALFTIYRFLKPKNILVISKDGFRNDYAVEKIGFVSWENVEDIGISTYLSQHYISVKFKKSYQEKMKKLRKLSSDMNRQAEWGDLNIPLSSAKEKYEDVLKIMMKYFSEYNSNKAFPSIDK